jgi:hypothetical protein
MFYNYYLNPKATILCILYHLSVFIFEHYYIYYFSYNPTKLFINTENEIINIPTATLLSQIKISGSLTFWFAFSMITRSVKIPTESSDLYLYYFSLITIEQIIKLIVFRIFTGGFIICANNTNNSFVLQFYLVGNNLSNLYVLIIPPTFILLILILVYGFKEIQKIEQHIFKKNKKYMNLFDKNEENV